MNENLILENQRTIMRALYNQSQETDEDLQIQINKTTEVLNPLPETICPLRKKTEFAFSEESEAKE